MFQLITCILPQSASLMNLRLWPPYYYSLYWLCWFSIMRGNYMTFTTLRFVIFFIILFAVYWTIPGRFRWICLLISDIIFYAFAGIPFLLLLIFSIIWSYLIGLWIDKADIQKSIFNNSYMNYARLMYVAISRAKRNVNIF